MKVLNIVQICAAILSIVCAIGAVADLFVEISWLSNAVNYGIMAALLINFIVLVERYSMLSDEYNKAMMEYLELRRRMLVTKANVIIQRDKQWSTDEVNQLLNKIWGYEEEEEDD